MRSGVVTGPAASVASSAWCRVSRRSMASLALKPLGTRVLASATALLAARGGALGLVDDFSTGGVRIAAAKQLPLLASGGGLPPDQGLAGRVLRAQRPLTLAYTGELAGRAALGVSLWWDGKPRGVLLLTATPGAALPRRIAPRWRALPGTRPVRSPRLAAMSKRSVTPSD